MKTDVLVAMLPGGDGSTFHFNALKAWLAAVGIRSFGVSMDGFSAPQAAGALSLFCDTVAQQVAERLAAPTQRTFVVGFGAGGGIAPFVIQALQKRGVAVAGLALLDALYRGHAPPKIVGGMTAMTATSVLDAVTADLDWPRLEKAIIDLLPSFKNRFLAWDQWQLIFEDAESHEAFKTVSVTSAPSPMAHMASVRTLLLMCTKVFESDSMQMFGGAGSPDECVAHWRALVPHMHAEDVDSSHVDVPYHVSTAEKVAAFVLALEERASDSAEATELAAKGRQAFERAKATMDKGRKDFKGSFQAAYAGVDFRRGAAGNAATTPAPSATCPASGGAAGAPSPEATANTTTSLEAVLASLQLESFQAALADEGYDDLATLKGMGEAELLETLREDVGMGTSDAQRLAACLQGGGTAAVAVS